jgi:hypothetical protein
MVLTAASEDSRNAASTSVWDHARAWRNAEGESW